MTVNKRLCFSDLGCLCYLLYASICTFEKSTFLCVSERVQCHHSLGEYCYTEFDERVPWACAVGHCQNVGGSLVDVSSDAENGIVQQHAQRTCSYSSAVVFLQIFD